MVSRNLSCHREEQKSRKSRDNSQRSSTNSRQDRPDCCIEATDGLHRGGVYRFPVSRTPPAPGPTVRNAGHAEEFGLTTSEAPGTRSEAGDSVRDQSPVAGGSRTCRGQALLDGRFRCPPPFQQHRTSRLEVRIVSDPAGHWKADSWQNCRLARTRFQYEVFERTDSARCRRGSGRLCRRGSGLLGLLAAGGPFRVLRRSAAQRSLSQLRRQTALAFAPPARA